MDIDTKYQLICHQLFESMEKLGAYLLDGRLEIGNNRSERSIKPFVIGRRKNCMFVNTPHGAMSSLRDTDKSDRLLPWSPTLPVTCHVVSHQWRI